MTEYDLGKVTGEDGTDGATIWVTSTAPSTPDYTFTISNLSGPSGATVKAWDIIIYSYYWYSITTVSSTTVLAGNRTSIRGAAGQNGTNGTNGTNGVGISSISKTGTSGKVDTYTITYTNGNTSTFTVTNGNDGTNGTNGQDGDDGVGIASITKTGTSGLVDTYTITYTDTNTSTFTVTNGSDASVTIVTSFGSTTSDSKVPSEKLVKDSLDSINSLIGNAISYINS